MVPATLDENLTGLFQTYKDQGFFNTEQEFLDVIESEGLEALYPSLPSGMFNSSEEFVKTFEPSLKKKDETDTSQSVSTLEQEDTESVQPGDQPQQQESGSSDLLTPPGLTNLQFLPDFMLSDEEVLKLQKELVDSDLGEQLPFQQLSIDTVAKTSNIPGELGQMIRGEYTTPNGESYKPLPGFLGKVTDILYSYGFGDKRTRQDLEDAGQLEPTLIGSSYRLGRAQADAVGPGLDMWFAGEEASDALINRYIASQQRLQGMPTYSDHSNFDRIMKENGDGVWGFLKGLYEEPEVAIETLISSYTAMFNPASLKAAGTVVGTGFAIGAYSTPIPDARAKFVGGVQGAKMSLKYAFGAGSMVLETGLSFTEFMQEELDTRGLDFDTYGVRQILSDPEAIERIRLKSATRGGIIGTVDMFFAGLAGEFGTKLYKATGRSGLVPIVIVGGEMVGGGTGEATALAATGQELDVKEIGLETIGGIGGAVTTTVSAFAKPPRVTIKGIDVSQKAAYDKIKSIQTIQDLEALGEINIENSPYLVNFLEETKTRLQIEDGLPADISAEDRKTLIALETQRKKLYGSPLQTNVDRVKAIDATIREINEKYMTEGEIQAEQAGGIPIVQQETTTETSQTLDGGTEIVTEETQTENVPLSEMTGQQPGPIPTPKPTPGLKAKMQDIEKSLKEEGIYVGRTQFSGNWFTETFDRIRKSLFSGRGFLPKSVFQSEKNRKGKINEEVKIAQQNNKKYERLLKKEVKAGGDGSMINDAFSALINGKPVPPNVLSPEMMVLGKKMRFHIDRLSQELMDTGIYLDVQGKIGSVKKASKDGFVEIEILSDKGEIVAREQRKGKPEDFTVGSTIKYGSKENIRLNLGEYVNRAYKIYESKNWNEQVGTDVKNRAKAYLMKQLDGTAAHKLAIQKAKDQNLNLTDQEVLERLAFQDVEQILASGELPTNWFNTGKMGTTNRAILSQRQDLAPEIRALMGEYTQPMQAYALSIVKQSQLVAGANFQVKVRESGLGKFLFEENDPATPEGFTATIAGEGSKTMEFLAGLRTTPEIAAAFEKQFNPQTMSKAQQTYYKVLGGVKWAKTVGDYEVHARNFVGNLGFVMANGHGDISQIANAFKVLANDLTTMSDEDLNLKMQKYVRLNLISADASLGEIKSLFQTENWEAYIEGVMQNQQKKGFWNNVKDYAGKPFKGIGGFMNDVYGGTDNFFKIYAYENEVARYSDAIYGVGYDQLSTQQQAEVDGMVSEIVLNTYPTYDRIPQLVKNISKNWMIGTFVAFQAESYRNAFNIVNQAKQELASDNPKIKAIGAKRMAGIAGYIGVKGSIQSSAVGGGVTGMAAIPGMIASAVGGGSDQSEENRKLRSSMDDFLPSWTRNHQLKIHQASDGKIIVQDMTSADGLGGIDSIFEAVMSADTPKDSFIDGLLEIAGTFGQQDIMFRRLEEIRQGKSWEEADTNEANAMATAAFFATILEPGSVARIRSSFFKESENYMKAGASAGEFWEVLSGMKSYEIDVLESMKFRMFDQKEYFQSAFRLRDRDMYAGEPRESQLKRSVEAMKPAIKQLSRLYYNAQQFGVSETDAYNTIYKYAFPQGMKKARKDQIMQIIEGDLPIAVIDLAQWDYDEIEQLENE